MCVKIDALIAHRGLRVIINSVRMMMDFSIYVFLSFDQFGYMNVSK